MDQDSQMMPDHLPLLCLALLVVAFLYSSVGHAGASGYIAVMALFNFAPDSIKPAALVLNIAVACLATFQFWRAGYFSWRLFWPFAVLSFPCAFMGGRLHLPAHVFKVAVGIVLLFSAIRFLLRPRDDVDPREPPKSVALPVGAGLGLLAGLTGTGGGIFLTPLLLVMRWARTKNAAAVSALFILVNSVSGLLGNFSSTRQLPSFVIPMLVAVVTGGAAGSWLGSRRFSPEIIKRLLAVVLTIAGLKLIWTR